MDRSKGRFISKDQKKRLLLNLIAKKIKSTPQKEIAIIGISGRYPLSESIEEFWENLCSGKNCIQEIPKDRWNWEDYYDPDPSQEGKTYSKWGGFIKDADKFDPLFFNISPKEAQIIDPQERLFLQTSWEAFEDAGYTRKKLEVLKKIGIFVGAMYGSYGRLGAKAWAKGLKNGAFSAYWSIANRVSYFFNLQGPSIAVDTACSSSLTAIHIACESLMRGECKMAIAGGVNLILDPFQYIGLSSMNMLSKGDKCKSFGEGADGFIDGEGVGAVLLKPLADAIADNDRIYAVIKGSSVNAGGKTSGFTVPNPNAQADVIKDALKDAKINPRTISSIEAHGTGTSLGDPIEITGLSKAFKEFTKDKQFCSISSSKSNLGHLESAAGIAGITKVVLQLKHKILVPSINSEKINPKINFEESPFYIQHELSEWVQPEIIENGQKKIYPRRSGISSFGAGGANAHIVLEEHIQQKVEISSNPPYIIILSAKNKERLKIYAEKMYLFLNQNINSSETSSLQIAYTLQLGRELMPERMGFIAQDINEIIQKFEKYYSDNFETSGILAGTVKRSDEKSIELKSIQSLIENKDFEKILNLWINGTDIEWQMLYQKPYPMVISLPTYPFERQRYFIPDVNAPEKEISIQKQTDENQTENFDFIYYASQFEKSDISQNTKLIKGNILIFDTDEKLKNAFKQKKQINSAIVLVKQGKEFNQFQDKIYEINPEKIDDYAKLFNELKDKSPTQIIHFWSKSDFSYEDESLNNNFKISATSVFFIAKTLIDQKISEKIDLIYIHNSATPEFSALSGLCKTIKTENPNIQARCVGINGQIINNDDLCTEIILNEISSNEDEVFYDANSNRTVKVLKSFALNKNDKTLLKNNGVYIITGGAGGLGLIIAEYLAENFNAKLVLTGRSDLSDEKKDKIKEIESKGGKILYIKADITKKDDAVRIVTSAKESFNQINGVIHSAGIHKDAFIYRKNIKDFESVISPKVFGTIYIDEVLSKEKLDFFALFSSISSLTGRVGQSDYAYGNAFLDYFASFRQNLVVEGKRFGRTISINWPLWDKGGMQISDTERGLLYEQTGISPLPSEIGLKAFENSFYSPSNNFMVLYGDTNKISSLFEKAPKQIESGYTEDKKIDTKILSGLIEKFLKKMIGNEIQLEDFKIDTSANFEEYGIDSIMIQKFNVQLEKAFGSLPKTLFFEYRSIKALSEYFVKNHETSLSKFFNIAETQQKKEIPLKKDKSHEKLVKVDSKPIITFTKKYDSEDIAIIGISGKYPFAKNIDEFWNNLKSGRDCISEIPKERWDMDRYFDPDPEKAKDGKIYCKWGGFIDNADVFDPLFFNITPVEVEMMDPQERLFLEAVWNAFEDAGYTRKQINALFEKYKVDVGVFAGTTTYSYQLLGIEEWAKGNFVVPNSSPWTIANRISYIFNFHGPSFPVDTACSSSLTAIYLACESLKRGECKMAVAGGVNLYLHPFKYVSMCRMRMLSPTGRCYTFGNKADGFVPGEGVGAIILKPLKDAENDRDNIYAVIKASSINHGGKTHGFTVPNPNAQADVIIKALQEADINPRTITSIEAHGTGTKLGDPVEIAGLTKAFKEFTEDKNFCSISSSKSNIGHLESGAGIAGITKLALQMRNKHLVPSIHAKNINPNIDFKGSPFYIQQGLEYWKKPVIDENGNKKTYPRRAGISSFGAGGANAHIILEEYDNTNHDVLLDYSQNIFVLSAKSKDRLLDYAKNILEFLEKNYSSDEHPEEKLIDSFKDELRHIASDILKVKAESIDLDENFSELGFDAVTSAIFLEKISAKFNFDLPSSIINDYPSISALSIYLFDNFKNILSKYYGLSHSDKSINEPEFLTNMAYTLQTGRESMEERISIIASTKDELKQALIMFCNSQKHIDNLYSGNVKLDKTSAELFIEGKEGEEFIKIIISEGKLNKIAKLWTSGIEIDWNLLYKDYFPKKISLPTYPFKGEKYWIPISNKFLTITSSSPVVTQKYFLYKTWKEAETKALNVFDEKGAMLILVNDETESLGRKIFAENSNINSVIVKNAKNYEKQSDTFYSFDFENYDQGVMASQALLGNKAEFIGMIDISDLSDISLLKPVCNFGKISLTQSLIKNLGANKFSLIHLTKDLEYFDSEAATFSGADFAGFVKMLGSEYNRVKSKTIDIDISVKNDSSVINLILNELTTTELESSVCVRKGKRYLPYMSEFPIEIRSFSNPIFNNLDKVIIITGGTRGIGFEIAKHLAEKGAKKLVLMGRKELPPKAEWKSIVENSNHSDSNKIKKIMALEEKGVSIRLYNGALTDKEKLSKFFGEVKAELGSISGVIHCAGVISEKNPAFINKTKMEIENVFEPKVQGLICLHEALLNENLKFFVLFSSVSGVIPMLGSGVSEYAQANAFMDYFAAFNAKQGRTYFKAINWPSWKEVGMGEIKSPVYFNLGLVSHLTSEGLSLLDKTVEIEDFPCIMPCVADKNKLSISNLLKAKILKAKTEAKITSSKPIAKPKSFDDNLVKKLKELFSDQLKIAEEKLDENTDFGDFGVDSILLADLVRRIEQWLGIKLEPSVLLECPTLSKLADYLSENFKDKLNLSEETSQEQEVESTVLETNNYDEEQPIITQESNKLSLIQTKMKIAVIGIGCDVPGSKNKNDFWNNLSNGVCSIREVPKSRWDIDLFYSKEYQKGKSISKWGGFLDDIEYFDPSFFQIREEDAAHIDPLIRKFLEVSVQTLRDAGYRDRDLWNKKVGVFVGSRMSRYSERIDDLLKNTIIGIGQNFIGAHISHLFNFKGPNVVVDSACSSSLVSVHLACQSLILGESEVALAGGVDVLLDESNYLVLSEAKALSPDGKCHTFDEKANGFVPGEGCGAILLKPLENAIKDGDKIYAVIESSAVNNDGHTMGITTPNPEAQAEVIKEALTKGSIDPITITYVETHGTGTMIGDPIELKALTKIFREQTKDRGFCAVGSVKTNIGHLASASGIAGLIKVILSVHNKYIPPTLNCIKPNPRFKFDDSPFYPNINLKVWAPEHLRRAGISSFGFGGTNAHIIIGECDKALLNGYSQKRFSLDLPVFNKKRFWLESKKNRKSDEKHSVESEKGYQLLFKKLK
ncbi:MAG: SDR family NAD(P)-dependent oxidoreductase [Desulfobacterales bacterium]|nr:SDR family NAD(P)-dependent oxidoreductase [Desulfobacterales bacterium]